MEVTENTAAKWLRYLFYVHIAGLILGLINKDGISWLMVAVTAAEVFCLWKLTAMGERYRTAALFAGIVVALNLAALLTKGSLAVTLAISVLGFIATWQEYHAHSELVADRDEKLSRRWSNLFWWEIVAGMLMIALTVASTLILLREKLAAAAIVIVITAIVTALGAGLNIVYLVFLHKTNKLFGV